MYSLWQEMDHQLDHYFHHCDNYVSTREMYWSVNMNSFSVELSHLYNLSDSDMSAVILGKQFAMLNTHQNQFLEAYS